MERFYLTSDNYEQQMKVDTIQETYDLYFSIQTEIFFENVSLMHSVSLNNNLSNLEFSIDIFSSQEAESVTCTWRNRSDSEMI